MKCWKIMVLALLVLCLAGISGAETNGRFSENGRGLDYTEGGHYDTDFVANFMSEWWYQNGDMRLVSEDGEKKEVAFFVVMTHQESPTLLKDPVSGEQLSHMATFYGLYPYEEAVSHNFTQVLVNRSDIENYIAFHVPYLDFNYPEGLGSFYGSSSRHYWLDYGFDNMQLNLVFKPHAEKTIDSSEDPVNFTTYESSYGKLHGTVELDGKKYQVVKADGYFDHMIPYTVDMLSWEMEMHGWTWSELTTDNYQTVLYAVRGLEDGYSKYTYRHLTLLDKNTGKVIAEYSGDEVDILESNWTSLTINNMTVLQPSTLDVSAPGLHIDVDAQSVVQFDESSYFGGEPVGFVDFMSFQPSTASIKVGGNIEEGSAFYEYMVTDWGALYSQQQSMEVNRE